MRYPYLGDTHESCGPTSNLPTVGHDATMSRLEIGRRRMGFPIRLPCPIGLRRVGCEHSVPNVQETSAKTNLCTVHHWYTCNFREPGQATGIHVLIYAQAIRQDIKTYKHTVQNRILLAVIFHSKNMVTTCCPTLENWWTASNCLHAYKTSAST